jgi:ATP-binding cassette subfamily B protein
MAKTKDTQQKLTAKQRLGALLRVAKVSYQTAPVILYIRIASAVLDSVLPIVTTYFAARTTTELARAYNGEAGAGEAALMFVLLTALLGIVTTVWASVQGYVSRFAQYKLESTVTDQLMHQFLSLNYWQYDEKNTADLLDKSWRFSSFFSRIFDTLGSIVTAFVSLASSIVALAFVSWWLSLLLFVAVVPGLYIQYRLSKARTEHWTKNIESRRQRYNLEWRLLQIDGIAEIRLYGLVQHLLGLYRKLRDKDEKNQILIERRFMGKELLANIIEAAAEVTALIYVTLHIISHALPIGQFLFVQQIVSRGLSSVRSVTSSFMSIDEELVNLTAYDTFMNLPTQANGTQKITHVPDSIELKNVTFSYPQNAAIILHGVSLALQKGEHIAIVGENGAGKSTLVKLLLGFYYPVKGEVLIGGIPTTSLNVESWHEQVGVLQQAAVRHDYAVARDNVIFGDISRPFSKKRYDAALEKAEAKEFIEKLPKNDQTYIVQWMESEDGTPGVALSGGQQQRLALARNFYRDSSVVILDEPTSAIDALAESRIFKRLFDEKDKTIIAISHRLSTVRRADRIYVLENGAIVEQGSHAELVKKQGAYVRLFESQL